ncbi:MAG: hypothetical protein JOZ58_10995 [Acetobacteraceae bacterium]|nr:hypothetical protein [Acetobacteraceae bacterium]
MDAKLKAIEARLMAWHRQFSAACAARKVHAERIRNWYTASRQEGNLG